VDDAVLRARAREAIQSGALPRDDPLHTWGGRGTGRPCDVCGRSILSTEIELELEFVAVGRPLPLHRMHPRCFIAWQQARQEP
jgi:hypothetical protein